MAFRAAKLSVAYRIGGGFSLLVLLMSLSSILVYWNFFQIDRQITTASDQVYPIQTHSNRIFVAILSANKAANQRLANDDASTMDALETEFLAYRNNYLTARAELDGLALGVEQVEVITQELDTLAGQFFETATQGFENHNQTVLLTKNLRSLKTDLRHEMGFFGEDLNQLSSDYDSKSPQAFGAMLKEQFLVVREEFAKALASSNPSEVVEVQQALKMNGYGIRLMSDIVTQLQSHHTDAAKVITETLMLLTEAANGADGVLATHRRWALSSAAGDELQAQLSQSINALSAILAELSGQSHRMAATIGAETRELISFSQMLGIVSSIVALLIAIITGLSVWLSIKRPLQKVMPVIQALAEGDMTQRVDHQGQDEFGLLAGWVNELADKLEKAIFEIKSAALNINRAAQTGSDISQRSMNMSEQQKQQTNIVATSMFQMAEAVKEVAYNADRAQQQIEHIDSRAHDNRELMNNNVDTVNAVAEEINRACDVVAKLNLETNNIGHILEVIQGIAEQTNLLALNAAIEAARAGEQGRGFAVVADEVRSLASRTQSSVQEINSMIERLQSGARDAADIMSVSQEKVRSSVNQAQQAGCSLVDMVERLAEIRSMSTQIAAAAEQQTAVCSGISEGVESITEIAEENAIEGQNSARESRSLALLADQHLSLSSQFKISHGG